MKKIIAAAVAAVLCLSCTALTGCDGQNVTGTSFAMGSVFTYEIFSGSDKAKELSLKLNSTLAQCDKTLNPNTDGSDIARLNAQSGAVLSEFAYKTVKKSVDLCKLFNGTLDVTIGAVSSLWGFDGDTPTKPADEDIQSALATVGCDKAVFSADTKSVRLGQGQKIDLGAFGKGAACDELITVMKRFGIPAVLSFGGTVTCFGKSPRKSGWSVGVRNPKGTENDFLGIYTLKTDGNKDALCISTSGKYEKTFVEDGKTYHHILSSETGYPTETDLASVTVICGGGLNADALSTALFINGESDFADLLIKSFNAGALFVYDNGTVKAKGSYADCFTLTNDSFKLSVENENG